MSDDIKDKIEELGAAGIKRVRGDEGEVEAMDIDDLIKADQYTAAQTAVAKAHLGIRFRKIVPPGVD